MKNIRMMMILVALLFIAGAAYAQYEPFRTDREAFQLGYEEGHKHGVADREMGMDFNYRHGHEFQSGISFDSYINRNFRSGYAEGYSDGYYSRSSYRDRDVYGSDRGGSSVTAFTRPGFRGSIREFRVGRYPYLDGRWNDNIASIEISGPVRVILFDRANFQGQRLILEEDSEDLEELNFGHRAASMIIEPLY